MVLQVPNVIPNLMKLLNHEKKIVRKEASWVISCITAGNQVQINVIIGNPDYLNKIISLVITDSSKEVVYKLPKKIYFKKGEKRSTLDSKQCCCWL